VRNLITSLLYLCPYNIICRKVLKKKYSNSCEVYLHARSSIKGTNVGEVIQKKKSDKKYVFSYRVLAIVVGRRGEQVYTHVIVTTNHTDIEVHSCCIRSSNTIVLLYSSSPPDKT